MKLSTIFLLLVLGLGGQEALGQTITEGYIEKWSATAVREMREYGIPASITLAQGILESGSGQSFLAQEANNHFGIKCHSDWEGEKVYRDDDAQDECFRAYASAEESFRDHSLFLLNRSRYASLFEEDSDDYKAWSKGLQKAGYATNEHYAERLIELVERYNLQRYDKQLRKTQEVIEQFDLIVYESPNRVDYVISRPGDTFESLAEATDKHPEDLLEYNELRYDAQMEPGQLIYLQPKRRRADRDFLTHRVKEGESMYQIAQQYAIRLEKLYRRNNMPIGAQPELGQLLELR